MVVSSKTMDSLKGIGLNLYERRLWVALLGKGSSTAGELAEISNVPRSRCYDTLQSLAEKGFVIVQSGKPLKYLAIPPKEAFERVKKRYEEKIKEMVERIERIEKSDIMKELENLYSKGMKTLSPEEIAGALKGKHLIHSQFSSLFKNAKEKIKIIATPESLLELAQRHLNVLRKAKEKGVKIMISVNEAGRAKAAIAALEDLAEIREHKDVPIYGRLATIDGREVVFGLSDPKVHETQDILFWSKSEHATKNVFEPIFEIVWKNAKQVKFK